MLGQGPKRASFAALCLLISLHAPNNPDVAPPTAACTHPAIEERTGIGTAEARRLLPRLLEERTGSLYLEIPRLDTPVLYVTGLAAGLGSNDIGLDRGQEGGGKIVSFERVGPASSWSRAPKTSAPRAPVPPNAAPSRTPSPSPSFWGFAIAAESNGRIWWTLPISSSATATARGQLPRRRARRLPRAIARSVVYLPRTKAFPKNTEI